MRGHQDVEVITSAVKVDVVAMPRMTLKELQSLEATKPIVEEVKDKEPVQELENIEEKSKEPDTPEVGEKDFANILKTFSKKKVKEEVVKPSKKSGVDFSKLNKKKLQALVQAGNQLSAGTELTGEQAEGDTSEFVAYIRKVRDQIRPFWKLPSFLADKDLSCRIRVFISRTGKLLKTGIITSSGNESFDQRAKDAIYQAYESNGKFLVPDKSFAKRASRGDIVLGFPI